jgi:ABC-2 type transport system permease protein
VSVAAASFTGSHRLRQSTALARRAVIATARPPQNMIPSFTFPLLFAAINAASLGRTIRLPGFPVVDSFLDFLLATTVVQGVMFGASGAGNDMAIDIETKFLDRLVASPVSRSAILVGRVTGAAAFACVQATVFQLLMIAFGARLNGGVLAFATITVAGTILGAGVGALSVALAIKTGSAEAVQGAFPLFFAFLFFSGAFFPRNLMKGWFHTVATINPLTWLIESLRHLVIVDFSWTKAAEAVAVPFGVFLVGTALAALALRGRIAQS